MHLDTLALASLSELKNPAVSLFDPDFIKIISPAGLVLNRCPEDIKTLDGVTDILNGAFANISTIRSITIPATVSYISNYCFYGCKSLETVNILGNVEFIGRYAFAGTSVKSITLPASVKTIWLSSFDGGDIKLLAPTPPEIKTSEVDTYQNQSEKLRKWTVEVPQGAYYSYNGNDMWNKTTLKESGAKRKYIITMEKPGTIMSKIPMSAWSSVDTLVIKGFLYDTDMNIMKKMASLKYADLSNTYISESPETTAENKRHREALNAAAKLIGAAGEMAYKDGKMSTPSYLMAKSIAEMESSEIKEADENCFIPAVSFVGLKQLETVKMPRRAVSIGSRAFAGCTNLRNVEFPPYVKTIGSEAFCDCEKLTISSLPKTITEIGDGAFKNCLSIRVIDLSACTFGKEFRLSAFNGAGLQTLKLPQGIETVMDFVGNGYSANSQIDNGLTIYFPTTIKRIRTTFWKCNLHFPSETPPSTMASYTSYRGSNNTIYVPKNCTTAYYNAFGDENRYIEE